MIESAAGDRARPLDRHGAPGVKAPGHGGSAARADSDDSDPWIPRLQPPRHPRDQGAVSDLHDRRVERTGAFELDPDRSGPLGDRGSQPVLDENALVGGGVGVGAGIGLGPVGDLDLGAERPHSLDLARRSAGSSKDVHTRASRAGGVCQPLAEVARRRAHPGALGVQLLGDQPRASTLEAPDRVEGLNLDHDLTLELRGETLVDELG